MPLPNDYAGWRFPRSSGPRLVVAPLSDPTRLNGAGMIVVNPPWTLENELCALLPALASILGREGKGRFQLDWLGEPGSRSSQ